MTPRDQIQEHAKIASAKIREAMEEFVKNTGYAASLEIDWLETTFIDDRQPTVRIRDVRIITERANFG